MTYLTFAEMLKSKRESAGLTQWDLAHKSKVKRQLISLIEINKRNASYSTAVKLAAALGLSARDRRALILLAACRHLRSDFRLAVMQAVRW